MVSTTMISDTQWLNMFHYSYIPWGRHPVGSINGLFRALGCPCICPGMVIAPNDRTTCSMAWSCWHVRLSLMGVCVCFPGSTHNVRLKRLTTAKHSLQCKQSCFKQMHHIDTMIT